MVGGGLYNDRYGGGAMGWVLRSGRKFKCKDDEEDKISCEAGRRSLGSGSGIDGVKGAGCDR
jgi:hypothetical protein